MAARYSGQYAAAQLNKLQLPHTLLLDTADYIGHNDLDLLLPPTHLTFARRFGRLPTDISIKDACFPVFDHELHNYHIAVSAHSVSMNGNILHILHRTYHRSSIERIRAEAGAYILFNVTVLNVNTPEDLAFFARCNEQYGKNWPRVRPHAVHRKLRSSDERFRIFWAKHQEHTRLVETIVRRHNIALGMARTFYNDDDDESGSP